MAARQPSRSRRRSAVVVAGLVAVGGATAALAFGNDAPKPASTLSPTAFPETGVVHVHGLGVDPADDVLYAATHSGLFRIADRGPATRVANRYADIMGFEIIGARHFIGSGHPDFREYDEPLMGLIESTDGGVTWDRVSLYGEADLHAIEVGHDQVYAYDSTGETFMVSSDAGRTWDRRAAIALLDVEVSPADPQVLLGATEAGLVRTEDGGRTWTALAAAPQLAVLDWDDAGEVLGVTVDGAVQASSDSGATWSPRGDVDGEPEAMTLADVEGHPVLFVAVSEGRILESKDGGRSFAVRYSDEQD